MPKVHIAAFEFIPVFCTNNECRCFWFCSAGIAFNAIEGPRFKQVLHHAKLVRKLYCPLTRHAISHSLLRLHYNQVIQHTKDGILKDVADYGITSVCHT